MLAAAAFVLGLLLAGAFGAIAIGVTHADPRDANGTGLLIGSFVGLWIPLVGAALLASRRFGTRSPSRDLGLRIEVADVGIGLLAGIAGLVATSAVQLLLSPFPDLIGSNTNFVEEQAKNPIGVVVIVVSTLIGAPIVEELFFRGLLQHAMARLGLLAVVVQAAIFGLIHYTPDQGLGNVGIVLGIGTFGLVLGLAARHTGRLGTSMIGHALFNTAAVLPLLLR